MRASQQFSVTLPGEMAEIVDRKVRSGDYASVSDLVQDGVRALLERETGVERWLRDEVLPGHAEYLADTSKGVEADALLADIKARRRKT